MKLTKRPDLIMARGYGPWLWDQHDRRFLDLLQGWAVTGLGHSHPEISKTISEQSKQLLTPSPAFHNVQHNNAAEKLAKTTNMDRVCFVNSGAEANEAAVKLARKYGQLHGVGNGTILTLEGGFHGRTLAMMAATAKPGWNQRFPPSIPGFEHLPKGDLHALEIAIRDGATALMLEPIQGEAGVHPLDLNYLLEARKLCKKNNVVFIADEIQTGCMRCGHMVLSKSMSLDPDLVTLGKGLGNGFPVAALLAKENHDCFELGDQGGTYSGNPLACSVVSTVLDLLQDINLVQFPADKVITKLKQIGFVRGKGHLLGIERPGDAHELVGRALELGLLLNAPNSNTLRLMPALNMSEEVWTQTFTILEGLL